MHTPTHPRRLPCRVPGGDKPDFAGLQRLLDDAPESDELDELSVSAASARMYAMELNGGGTSIVGGGRYVPLASFPYSVPPGQYPPAAAYNQSGHTYPAYSPSQITAARASHGQAGQAPSAASQWDMRLGSEPPVRSESAGQVCIKLATTSPAKCNHSLPPPVLYSMHASSWG